MGRRFTETERKYDITDAADAAATYERLDLAGVADTREEAPVRLDAVYYDTPALDLAAHRVTLRRRTGGDDAGWHLKLPTATADARTEVHAPLGDAEADGAGDPDAPPAELRAEVAALTRGRPLTPVVRLRTTRRRVLLLDASAAAGSSADIAADIDAGAGAGALAEIAYDEVTADPGAQSWAEIEVELGRGDPALLDAIEERLLAAGARPSASRSKLARALGDRVTPAPRPPRDLRTAGDVALAYLHAQYAALLALDPAVRRAEEDAVHRMRVATRRARSALKSFRRELDRTATDPLGAELKWCAAALGGERDREVLAERLHRRLAELDAAPHAESDAGPHAGPHAESDAGPHAGPHAAPHAESAAQSSPVTAAAADAARRRIGTYAAPDRTAPARTPRANANANASATAGAPPEMAGARYFALLDAFQTLLAAPPYLRAAAAPAAPAAAAVLRRDHARLRLGVEEALATDPGDARDTALHEARKEAKRARYSAEAAEAVLGAEAAAHTARMKQVQQLLGEHQDSVMCRTAVAALRAAAVAAGEDPAPYDAIIRRERALAADAEARLPEVWQAARQAP